MNPSYKLVARPRIDELYALLPKREAGKASYAAILEAAELVFAGAGIESVKITDVIKKAGVGIQTLYGYFPNGKDDLVLMLWNYRDRRIKHALRNAANQMAALRQLPELMGEEVIDIPPFLLAQIVVTGVLNILREKPALDASLRTHIISHNLVPVGETRTEILVTEVEALLRAATHPVISDRQIKEASFGVTCALKGIYEAAIGGQIPASIIPSMDEMLIEGVAAIIARFCQPATSESIQTQGRQSALIRRIIKDLPPANAAANPPPITTTIPTYATSYTPEQIVEIMARYAQEANGPGEVTEQMDQERAQDEALSQAKAETEAMRARYHNLFDCAPLGYLTLNPQGFIVEANLTAAPLFEVSPNELLTQTFTAFIHKEDHAPFHLNRSIIATTKETRTFELRLLKAGGVPFWVEATATPALEEGAIRLALRDLSAGKKIQTALRTSEARLLALVDWTPEPLLIHRDGIIIHANMAATHLFGATTESDLIGRHLIDRIKPEFRNAVLAWRERMNRGAGHIEMKPLRCLRLDGSKFDAEAEALLIFISEAPAVLVSIHDVSSKHEAERERENLMHQLQHSQKMESLGTLTGGVAHHLNNVLGAIVAMSSALLALHPEESPSNHAFDTILQAANRGGVLVKSLLMFARQTKPSRLPVDLNAIILDEVKLLEYTTLARIQFEVALAPNLLPIYGDGSALSNAIMNLCVNAVDAMEDTLDQGLLTFQTRNDGDWVLVTIGDNGTGMSKETKEKAVAPFFTTKEAGKGTGLGLHMVHNTLNAHFGKLEIESELGRGTRITLRLPTYQGGLINPMYEECPNKRASTALTVLVVDDDELLRDSVKMILVALGHVPILASSGEEAIGKFEGGTEPDLVILDINMPGLGGVGTLPLLRTLRPNLPIILSTGNVNQIASNLVAEHHQVQLLPKPFGVDDLRERIRTMLP